MRGLRLAQKHREERRGISMKIYVKVPLHTFLSLCAHQGDPLLQSMAGRETVTVSRTVGSQTQTIRLRLTQRIEDGGYVSAEETEEDGEK